MRRIRDFFRYREYEKLWTFILFAIPAAIGASLGFVFFGKIGAVVCAMLMYVLFAFFSYNNIKFYSVWASFTSKITKTMFVLCFVALFLAIVVKGLSVILKFFGTQTTKIINHSGQAHLAFAEIYK